MFGHATDFGKPRKPNYHQALPFLSPIILSAPVEPDVAQVPGANQHYHPYHHEHTDRRTALPYATRANLPQSYGAFSRNPHMTSLCVVLFVMLIFFSLVYKGKPAIDHSVFQPANASGFLNETIGNADKDLVPDYD